ncbi:TetR/AcrR family transcriptional regulator [Paenibacillus arenilitoris]|uniref:TetR/AcrR family transcriptional regulator n=1 Tax=Paenibacillus arenilitoris TaxID=2772299 RepID=A0A927CU66_9BACL|nr:TetR/AcrR family transcriptional regulator [Paenibacillus arenilitoris]
MQGDKTREKIIAFATMHFFTFGYSKVSTEDLVSGLAMSKSTMYKYFPR